MKIDVRRFTSDTDTTLSLVSVDGKFQCFGLEDEYRAKKVMGETRIPAGRYPVILRKVGGFDFQYRARFPDLHQGMPHITNVPGFEYILIHCGNTDEDTAGCLLVGASATSFPGNMSIAGSALAYRALYRTIVADAAAGKLTIEFFDDDRALTS